MINFFDRLEEFMKIKGLNDNRLSIETGISNGLIGKARIRGSLSLDNISKILNTYPELNANWLIIGKGAMYNNENQLNSNKVIKDDYIQKDYIIEVQKKLIEKLEVEISILKEKNKG